MGFFFFWIILKKSAVVHSFSPFYCSFVGIFVFFIILLIKKEKRKRKPVTALEGILKLSLTCPMMLFYFLAKKPGWQQNMSEVSTCNDRPSTNY